MLKYWVCLLSWGSSLLCLRWILTSFQDFFHGKPTRRSLKTQHPYLSEFVGEPHVSWSWSLLWCLTVKTNKTTEGFIHVCYGVEVILQVWLWPEVSMHESRVCWVLYDQHFKVTSSWHDCMGAATTILVCCVGVLREPQQSNGSGSCPEENRRFVGLFICWMLGKQQN